ncbi:MAG: hypothetical protein AAGH79_07325 [Bacteroidota bacterium]
MKHSDSGANWKKALIHLWIGFLLLLFFYLLSFGSHWRQTRLPWRQGSSRIRVQQSWTGQLQQLDHAFYQAKFITKIGGLFNDQ